MDKGNSLLGHEGKIWGTQVPGVQPTNSAERPLNRALNALRILFDSSTILISSVLSTILLLLSTE